MSNNLVMIVETVSVGLAYTNTVWSSLFTLTNAYDVVLEQSTALVSQNRRFKCG